MELDRRAFLGGAVSLALFGGCRTARRDEDYSVILLGDTHFDGLTPSAYHTGWQPRDGHDLRDRQREFARNGEMWRERLPMLIADAARRRPENVRAVIHVGDLIQGDTANAETQLKMLRDAEAACRSGMEDLPFLLACGNHDIRNRGAAGFDRYLPQAERLVPIGPDCFIFVDFMRPDPSRLEWMLKAAEGARHTFIVSHGLSAPHDGWGYYWFLFGKKKDTEVRRHFRHEFLRRHVIFIGGHIHATSVMEWRTREGSYTQFSVNSVWTDPAQGEGKVAYASPAQYGSYEKAHPTPMGEEHDGCHQNRTPAEALALFDEYRTGLVRYWCSPAAGHYQLHVSDRLSLRFLPPPYPNSRWNELAVGRSVPDRRNDTW